MPRERDLKRDEAFELYKDSKGNIRLVEIANKLEVPEGTIRGWKNKDKWDDVLCGKIEKVRNAPKVKKEKKRNGAEGKAVKNETQKQSKLIELEDDEYDWGLTERQKLFCEIYVNNFNASQAAIRAGYAKSSARVEGCRQLTKDNIKAYIAYLKQLKKAALAISEDDIIERYMRIAFADMTDLINFGVEEVPELDEEGNPVLDEEGNIKYHKRNYLNFKSADEVDGGLICEITVGKQGTKVKLEDRQKALDWLAKWFNMNPMDRHRQRYDDAKLEIDKKRLALLENKVNGDTDGVYENDGYIDAMKTTAAEVWTNE